MKKIVIFGLGDNAELAKHYFENDEKYKIDHKVVAFTVEKKFMDRKEFNGLPVVEFENIEKFYPKEEYYLFVAVGYTAMNEVREKIYLSGKEMGYRYVNYISSKANIFTENIGENNFILEDNTIQPFVKIGNNCFITSHVVISGRCRIADNCFIGVNSTVRDHVTIEYKSLIGAGAWISKNTEEYGVYLAEQATKINKKSIELKIS